jgi:rhodanese-related sulfurtransferase
MTRLRTRLAILAAALALASCAGQHHQAPATQTEYKKPVRMNGRGALGSISLGDFYNLQQSGKALIYDARPAFFYQLGHVPGAINLTKSRCDDHLATSEPAIKSALAKGKTIVVYCSGITCPDARTVAIHISGFGYPAKIFSGGWDAWKEAGLPVD